MPSTIPYNPALTLTSVVAQADLDVVKAIADTQAPVDAAQDELNSLLASRRSLDMTISELVNLNIDVADIKKEITNLNKTVATAAKDYATAKIAAETKLLPLRSAISMVHSQIESPVDYVKTQIKSLPLAADSMNMDVQYFSFDVNSQNSNTFANTIAGYVSAAVSFLGDDFSTQASTSAQQQVHSQVSKHNIVGTLVIAVTCTHKMASILAPCVLNVDKAIKVWNNLNPGDTLDPTIEKQMASAAKAADDGKKKFSIISGTTFGSSFVGMVHVLNTTTTTASESLTSFASSVQAQMDAGCWFEKESGGFGVNSSFSNDVKNLLSSQNITSHVTLISMGVIPSIVASDVQLAVQSFSKFDPEASMQQVATIQNAAASDQDSVGAAAEAARLGGQMIAMKTAQVKSTLSALAEIKDGSNKILDINSMMTALDDYLKKAGEGNAGVPINYYLKDITKKMLAEMWVAKYLPGKYNAITYDDGAAAPSAGGGGGSGGGSAPSGGGASASGGGASS